MKTKKNPKINISKNRVSLVREDRFILYYVNNIFIAVSCFPSLGSTSNFPSSGTAVTMVTIVLTYLATSTTLLILFWFLFCYPAIKHNQLHKKITQEQVC